MSSVEIYDQSLYYYYYLKKSLVLEEAIPYGEGKKYMEGFEILKERYNSILLNYINSLLYNR